jgi:hypothetical protein
MVELSRDKLVILFAVVFPLALMLTAIYLGSGVCVIIPLMVWIGIALMMIYLPTEQD